MQKKYKITYFDYGVVKAKIILADLNTIGSIMIGWGINTDNVIKIEAHLEADEEDVVDTTQ